MLRMSVIGRQESCPMPANAAKVCVVCGEDVSAKPRTKDGKGRYFCTACYERAVAGKHARHAEPPAPPAPPRGARTDLPIAAGARMGMLDEDDDDDAPLSLDGPSRRPNPAAAPSPAARAALPRAESPPAARRSAPVRPAARAKPAGSPPPHAPEPDDLIFPDAQPSVLEQLIDLEPAHAPAPMICPACRSDIPSGGFICSQCGYNLQTGEAQRPVRIKDLRPSGTVWPVVVGVMSMIFGIGGLVLYGIYLLLAVVGALQTGELGDALVSIIPIGTLTTGLAAWLTRDGYRILRHDAEGVKWIRFWAMAKLLLYGGCLSLLAAVPIGVVEDGLRELPGLEGKVSASDVKMTILMLLVWFLGWPAFVMVFFFIPRIQDDVEAWR